MLGALFAFIGLPMLVIPCFLDFAQEAKTSALVASIIFLAIAAVFFPRARQGVARSLQSIPTSMQVLLAVLVSFAAVSSARSDLPPLVATYALRNMMVPIGAAALLYRMIGPRWSLIGIAAGSATIAGLGLLQVAFDIKILTPQSDLGQFPAVTFGNRGLASLFVGLGLVPTFYLMQGAARPTRLLLMAGAAAQGLFVAVAMTRSTMLATLVSLILWSIGARRTARHRGFSRRLMALTSLGLAVVAFGLFASNEQIQTLLWQRLDPANWIQNPRIALWSACLQRWAHADFGDLLLGFGPGSFQFLAREWTQGTRVEHLVFRDAHNDFLQLLVEQGVAGAVVVAMILAGMALNWQTRTRSGATEVAAFASIAVVILVSASLFYPFQIPFFAFIFWYGVFSMCQSEPSAEVAPSMVSGAVVWLGLALAIVVLPLDLYRRSALEIAMRSYVSQKEPYVTKRWRQINLERTMRTVPAPTHYHQIVGKALGRRSQGSPTLSPSAGPLQ